MFSLGSCVPFQRIEATRAGNAHGISVGHLLPHPKAGRASSPGSDVPYYGLCGSTAGRIFHQGEFCATLPHVRRSTRRCRAHPVGRGTEVSIEIYRLETSDWSLEVIDETGASTVWSSLFPTDQAALDEVLKTIREEGIRTFLGGGGTHNTP